MGGCFLDCNFFCPGVPAVPPALAAPAVGFPGLARRQPPAALPPGPQGRSAAEPSRLSGSTAIVCAAALLLIHGLD